MTAIIQVLLARLESGNDGPLLRFALGKGLLDANDAKRALPHLREAVRQDPDYAAAWAQLGRCELALGAEAAAIEAWSRGRDAARLHGEVQAERQISVWLRRAVARNAGNA
ncbi:tetratricopeptide repeat protein [Rhizobium rhizogenes]|uniref:tetratricopeptide repeat protein n=1 Tax=Rhizobium rhizogenes TaxID=359 RepID=UPI00226ED28F|nr:tetratricopeptide repeat protein [Rhizobium rhizogenes]